MPVTKSLPLKIIGLAFGFIFLAQSSFCQTPIPERKITVSASDIPLEQALKIIETKAHFRFSYNADELPLDSLVTISAQNQPVGKMVKALINKPLHFKVSGDHLILLPVRADDESRSKYVIAGYVENARTGERIPNATVYDINRNSVALTNDEGYYQLTVSTEKKFLGIGVSKEDFIDTVIIVRPHDMQMLDVKLLPYDKKIDKAPIRKVEPKMGNPEKDLDELPLVKLVVPQKQLEHSRNLYSMLNEIPVQISFLPNIGTNRLVSGAMENNFSLNILAGYSMSLKGFEVGGLLNIDRKDVTGFQVSGFGNIVGGKVKGVQIAGFSNNIRGSLAGGQVAGFSNIVLDTIVGAQISGFSNVLKGKITGAQISGFSNVSTQDVDGVQISGFSNVAGKDVNSGQVSGFFNYGRNVKGAQIAGFTNVASQFVTGTQIAGFANVAAKDVTGTQISAFVNFARKVRGSQIGFLNLSDSVSGAAIGFLSFALHGYHAVELFSDEVMPANIAFKTGGNDHFYNIFTGGIRPRISVLSQPDFNGWSFGYGVGSELRFGKRWAVNFDVTASQVNEQKNWQATMNLMGRFNIDLNLYLTHHIALNAGPAFCMLGSQLKDNEGRFTTTIARSPFYVTDNGQTQLQMWWGWHAGILL